MVLSLLIQDVVGELVLIVLFSGLSLDAISVFLHSFV